MGRIVIQVNKNETLANVVLGAYASNSSNSVCINCSERCDGRGAALCGCNDCNEEIWGRTAGNFTCLGRILGLLVEDDPDTRRRYTEEKACAVVSSQFMDICGPECHPGKYASCNFSVHVGARSAIPISIAGYYRQV